MFLRRRNVQATLKKAYVQMQKRRNELALSRNDAYVGFDVAANMILQIAAELKIEIRENDL